MALAGNNTTYGGSSGYEYGMPQNITASLGLDIDFDLDELLPPAQDVDDMIGLEDVLLGCSTPLKPEVVAPTEMDMLLFMLSTDDKENIDPSTCMHCGAAPKKVKCCDVARKAYHK
eukprot:scaffold30464_cov38-Prasinocladus_malaysianus.AAC.1